MILPVLYLTLKTLQGNTKQTYEGKANLAAYIKPKKHNPTFDAMFEKRADCHLPNYEEHKINKACKSVI